MAACSAPERPLRVGTIPWPGYEPLYVARSLGYLDAKQVQLVDFSSAAEVVRAWHNGLIDAAALTADEALLAGEDDHPERVILVCDYSNGADVVLARPPIASLPELKGKRIGVEMMAVGAYTLTRALQSVGMSPEDVVTVPLGQQELLSAYRAKQVDAVVTFDPVRSRLLADGAQLLFDSSRIPGEIVDVIVARPAEEPFHDRALQALVQGWFRGADYMTKNPGDAAKRVATREAVSPEEFQRSLSGVRLLGARENVVLLGESPGNLGERFATLRDVMLKRRLVPSVPPAPPLDAKYVKAVVP